jgi:hypothetical protein
VISLPAGEYYLMANMQSVLSTYYPGTRDPDKAKPILVTDGGETPSIDFVMHAGSPSIDGTVRPAVPQATVAQMVIAPIPRDPAASMVTSYGFAFDPQATPPGQFSIRTFSLSPGLYDLHAVMTTLDMDYFGSTTITVGDQAIDNVAIQLHPGVELKGHVTLQGNSSDIKLNDAPIAIRSRLYNSANRTSQVRTLLTLQAMDTARRTGAQLSLPREIPPSSPVGNDGTFTIRSIPAGAFTIQPATPPGACLIDVVQEGKSVLATGFTVGATSPAPLEVTISSACPSIAGLLQSKQQPQRFTRVVLVPTGERQRSYGLYRTVMTDQNGRFSFENVTPGEYKLFSWRSIPDGAWTNAEYLARYMERGTSVTAREGPATATVEFITD